jgi:ABC-type transport system involved in multi-copper enzyme maturation permease subunit
MMMAAKPITWQGLRTVTQLEIRRRVRSRKLFIGLVVWFVVLGALLTLMFLAFTNLNFGYNGEDRDRVIQQTGMLLYSLLVFVILGLSLLIAPGFTASTIVSDRESATLATLQVTQLTPLEIALGKLVSAWALIGLFVAATLPYLVVTAWMGQVNPLRVVWSLIIVFVEVAFICAIGLGWSAIMNRSLVASVMTYVSVLVLTIMSFAIFALGIPLVTRYETHQIYGLTEETRQAYYQELAEFFEEHPTDDGALAPAPPLQQCTWMTEDEFYDYDHSPYSGQTTVSVVHSEYIWWLLFMNPAVIVADAAAEPIHSGDRFSVGDNYDLLTGAAYAVRIARTGGTPLSNYCNLYNVDMSNYSYEPGQTRDALSFHLYTNTYTSISRDDYWVEAYGWESGGQKYASRRVEPIPEVDSPVPSGVKDVSVPAWPFGLLSNVIIGGLFFYIAVRRLRIPYGPLPKGTRIA